MEEETTFDDELSALQSVLSFQEPDFPLDFKANDLKNLQSLLNELQETPLEIDSKTKVFLISEAKMSEFITNFSTIQAKFFAIEKNFLDEKLKNHEEISSLNQQIRELSSQNSLFLKPKTSNFSFFQQNFIGNSFSSQNPFSSQLLTKPLDFSENTKDLQIKELKDSLEQKTQENQRLYEKFALLTQDFKLLNKEKNEFSEKIENNPVFFRLKTQQENQRIFNENLQIELKTLKNKLKFYENYEKMSKNSENSLKEIIVNSFVDLIDEGLETTSDCENEIICRYFPETIKRLKLKLENESLKEKLIGISKDLDEEKEENKKKMEVFLKEVMKFEEIKENILKKIDEFIEKIKELAIEKIRKFDLNIKEFGLQDEISEQTSEKLVKSYGLIEELTEKLGRNIEINQKLAKRYEMDILMNKELLEDLSKITQEKNEITHEKEELLKILCEEREKSKRNEENLKEKLKEKERNLKGIRIENELLNLSMKKTQVEDINFQLFQHFKHKFEEISIDYQVLLNKMHVNKENFFDLSTKFKGITEENARLSEKIKEFNPENLLLTLMNVKEGSLKEILKENLENKTLIKELRNSKEKMMKKLKENEIEIKQLKLTKESEEKMRNKMNILELLEKSKVLLQNQIV